MRLITKSIVNKRIPVQENSTGVLTFGPDNDFPQQMIEVVEESGTASAAIDVICEFVEGNGWKDIPLAEFVINKEGDTLDTFLSEQAWNASYQVLVVHVSYNALGKISSFRFIPHDQIRFFKPDGNNNITHIGIFPYIGNDLYEKDKDKCTAKCFVFDPRQEVVLEQINNSGGLNKYPGQIWYMPTGRRRGSNYVIPSWFAPIYKDMQTEARLSNYDFRVVSSDFAVAGIFMCLEDDVRQNIAGHPEVKDITKEFGSESLGEAEGFSNEDLGLTDDSPTPSRAYELPAYMLDNLKGDIVGQIENHMGDDNAASVMVLTFNSPEALKAAKFESTSGVELADRYNAISERVPQKIATSFRVANELVGIRRQGGLVFSNPEEYEYLCQLMQGRVNRVHRKLGAMVKRLLENWWTPVSFTDYTIENLDYFIKDKTQQAGNGSITETV